MMSMKKSILLVLVTISVTSCTNNEWFLSAIYNRADNIFYSNILDYADFDKQQRQILKLKVKQFHHWHRTTQLPKYVEFLNSLSQRVHSSEQVEIKEIQGWSDQIEGFVKNLTACHPILFSHEFLSGLTDEQVEQIADHAKNEYEKSYKRFEKKNSDERLEERYKNTLKWLKRFQLDIDEIERQLLRKTMEQEVRLQEASFELWSGWDKRFHELLLSRTDDDFEVLLKQHVLSLGVMLKDAYPKEVEFNLELWVQFFHQIAQSELHDGRQGFARWADKMAKNLTSISESIPKKQLNWDAKAYCS